MNEEAFNNPTPYQDINQLLFFAAHELKNILANNIASFYLTGSLSYNDFVPGRSDIDLLVIVKRPLSKRKTGQVKQLHLDIEKRYPQWAERIECSYLPASELENISPPIAPRPYIGGGIFYPEAPYGNEWIINQWYLYKYAIALIGPGFTTLTAPIHIDDVRKACLADLFTEWAPKINEPEWLENGHYQSYLVLNLCRILYTVIRGNVGSKSVSSKWVQNEYPEWIDLIATALNWRYDIKMAEKEKVIEFLRFTLDKVVHSS